MQWIVGIPWEWMGYIECIWGAMGSCGNIGWMGYNECIWGAMDSWGTIGMDGVYIERIWVKLGRWGKLNGWSTLDGKGESGGGGGG